MLKYKCISNGLRVACLCVAALPISALSLTAQTTSGKTENNVLQIKISTDRKSYAKDEDIPVHVQITNTSSHAVLVGTNMWTNASPARVSLAVVPRDGHVTAGEESAVDGISPRAFDDFPRALLNWCLSLPAGYSYSSSTSLRHLTPGVYKVVAEYESQGVDSETVFNPLLTKPDELAKFRAESWRGFIASDAITVTITSNKQGRTGPIAHTP